MTSPPTDDVPNPAEQPTAAPVEPPFDPYRFGAPEHPIPPEFAPPGYVPPPIVSEPQPGQPPTQPYPYPQYPQYPQYPYPGQPYGAPPPWASQYPQHKPGNGKAIAGLVLGIAAVVFFWTTLLDAVPVILAIVFGSMGLSDAKRTGQGRNIALTGIVLGVVGALFAVIFTVWIYSHFRPCFEDYNSGSSEYNSCIRSHI
jgi:hypothetical protein